MLGGSDGLLEAARVCRHLGPSDTFDAPVNMLTTPLGVVRLEHRKSSGAAPGSANTTHTRRLCWQSRFDPLDVGRGLLHVMVIAVALNTPSPNQFSSRTLMRTMAWLWFWQILDAPI